MLARIVFAGRPHYLVHVIACGICHDLPDPPESPSRPRRFLFLVSHSFCSIRIKAIHSRRMELWQMVLPLARAV